MIALKALSIILAIGVASVSYAGSQPKRTKKPITAANAATATDVGTDFKFDGMTVRGQYQSANEGLVTVENEKELSNLLDYRTDYKDRLKNSRLNP